MRRQLGLSLSGLLVACVLVIVVALLGFKLFPAYAEYLSVKKALSEIMRNPESKTSPREIQLAFNRRAAIDNIRAVTDQDLDISKNGDRLSVSASWSVKVPLFYNVSACVDFEAKGE